MEMRLHAHQHFIQRSSNQSAQLPIVMHMMILVAFLHALEQIMSSHIVLAGNKKCLFFLIIMTAYSTINLATLLQP